MFYGYASLISDVLIMYEWDDEGKPKSSQVNDDVGKSNATDATLLGEGDSLCFGDMATGRISHAPAL